MGKQFYIRIDGTPVAVTEEVYRAYMRPVWAERKRKERESRCLDERGSRCESDCSKCGKRRAGSAFSLDNAIEGGFDVSDPMDMAEIVAEKLILEQLGVALAELELGDKALIDALFYDDRTERDLAAEIGISQQAVGKRKQKIVAKLRELMGNDC